MSYRPYATKEDVASFLGKPVDELPANIDKLISSASDLITNTILVRIYSGHEEALKLATCAQVEYWMETGDNENAGQVQSYSAASVSVTFRDNGPKNPICTRARGYLNREGLLYRGVRLS